MPKGGRRGNRRPRIAIVRHSAYPDDMHVRRDALALCDAGFEVDLICDWQPGHPFIEHIDGMTVLRIPPRHRRGGLARYLFEYAVFPLLATAVTALRSLRGRYHWVEVNNMPDWLIVAALVPKLVGTRVALYSREDMARLLALDHDLPLTHPAVRLLSRVQHVCCRLADRVIMTQELARHDLIQRGIPAEKVVAIPNAPDEAAFLARVPHSPIDPGRNTNGDGSFRLVTHGTLAKRYGVQTLLQAVALLRKRIPAIQLEIIGDGEYRPALQTIAQRLGLEDCVRFTGFVPLYEDVAPRLIQADLGVVPIWSDFQLCNKLVDYLALGLPAISTESAALRPYLDDSEVQYVEPNDSQALADAILHLSLDSERRAALGKAGHAAYLEHFSWERAKGKYLEIYSQDAEVQAMRSHPALLTAAEPQGVDALETRYG